MTGLDPSSNSIMFSNPLSGGCPRGIGSKTLLCLQRIFCIFGGYGLWGSYLVSKIKHSTV
jgi:hypothetical protein